MNSKISLLNKTLFKKNIIRFWPAWALYTVILVFIMPITIYASVSANMRTADRAEAILQGTASSISVAVQTNIAIVFVMSILFAVLLFGYLFNAASCGMYHSLPTDRNQLFFTGYLSGILFLVVPQAIMAGISFAIGAAWGTDYMLYVAYWLVTAIMISVLFFSEAVFCCMLGGHAAAVIAYYVGGNIVYVAFKMLVMSVASWLCYGVNYSSSALLTKDSCLSPIVYLYTKLKVEYEYDDLTGKMIGATPCGTGTAALYLIPAAVLIVLALMLYRRRQLECAGDIAAVGFMKPLFRWLVALAMGIGIAFIISYIIFSSGKYAPVAMIVLSACIAFAFFFFAEMILQKSFRVFTKRRVIGACICAGAALFLPLSLETDIFGIERKVPDAMDVQCVYVSAAYPRFLTEFDDILKAEDVHRTIIDQKEDYEEYMRIADTGSSEEILQTTYTYVHLVYYLTDGTSVERSYTIPSEASYQADPGSAVSKIASELESPESYLQYSICKNYEDVSFAYATMDAYAESNAGYVYSGNSLTTEQTEIVAEAALKDIREGNYPYGVAQQLIDYENECYSNAIVFTWKIDGKIEQIFDDPAVPDDFPEEYSYEANYYSNNGSADFYFNLYKTCTNTIRALIDTGVIEDESELTTYAELSDDYDGSEG